MKKLLLLIAMLCCLQASAGVKGDINGDNNVDVSDVNLVINKVLDGNGTANTDVNGDGTTDVSDVNIIINIVLGLYVPEETHEYVDLGLPSGTLWATCNVGAKNPEDFGLYFAWCSTVGYAKDEYYSFDGSDYTYTDIGSLPPKDDAASVNWGDDWRMPSLREIQELYSNTTSEWITLKGVYGRLVTSNTNGNSIFLPAAGYREGKDLVDKGYLGRYWSREMYPTTTAEAYGLRFARGFMVWGSFRRELGCTVRAVRVEKAE